MGKLWGSCRGSKAHVQAAAVGRGPLWGSWCREGGSLPRCAHHMTHQLLPPISLLVLMKDASPQYDPTLSPPPHPPLPHHLLLRCW